ncbi:cytidylate kinase [Williamsoniiplasma somnilux]|uniref:Cytidylate kinase n=1 Tax=Williamsoniiplasma somnilux TaxID=215578 RepID=A0A2K8P1F7_9MOLU|nr:(d)CMP kinase [Williamsoniiplasma somnilux]ATZ18841.1 cytidylate kinase [Williamsoniiplasma somnilux]
MKKIIIAVDGTAGSGKTITFKKIAEKLNYIFIDTGLMYRAFTIFGVLEKINFQNPNEIKKLIPKFNYEVKGNKIFVNNMDVTSKLQTSEVLENINSITGISEVRNMMVESQRKIALDNKKNGVIMVGRDITSVVLPDADLKIYLDSSIDSRAKRRYNQNLKANIKNMSLQVIKDAIILRDYTDKNREVGPLKLTSDSWYIDNSKIGLETVVKKVIKKIKELEGED